MKKKLAVLLSLVLVAVLLTGCKKDEPKPTEAPAAEVTEEVKTEGGN